MKKKVKLYNLLRLDHSTLDKKIVNIIVSTYCNKQLNYPVPRAVNKLINDTCEILYLMQEHLAGSNSKE